MLRSIFQSQANAAKSKAIGNVQKAAKALYFKYVLIFSLVIALYSAFSFLNPDNILFFFISFQIYSMILGIIHTWLMGKKFGWRNIHSFFEKLEMSLLILLVSMIITGIVVYFSPLPHLFYILPTGILFFLFPMMTISVFDFAMAIPPEEYKKWFYPEKVEMPDMDRIDFTNSYVLTFEIMKKDNERLPTFMKFKAPLNNITFGEMFYMYLFEYNEAHRESPIEYSDDNQKRFAWLFYVKPKHWWNSKMMVDPSLTVRENKIKENRIIVPYRV
ncbi:MAG: TssN family type VI secretion system protein [Bacteroidota bacterium]